MLSLCAVQTTAFCSFSMNTVWLQFNIVYQQFINQKYAFACYLSDIKDTGALERGEPLSHDKDTQMSILLEKRNVIMLNMDSVWQALQIQLCGQMLPPKQKRFVCQDKVLCEAMCYTMKSLIR